MCITNLHCKEKMTICIYNTKYPISCIYDEKISNQNL